MKITAKGYQALVTQYYPVKGSAAGEFDLVLIVGDKRYTQSPSD